MAERPGPGVVRVESGGSPDHDRLASALALRAQAPAITPTADGPGPESRDAAP